MSETLWKPGIDLYWLEAFKIPTLIWAKPLLSQLNLPPDIVANLSRLESLHPQIYSEIGQGYKWVRKNYQTTEEIAPQDVKVLGQVICKAFRQLDRELGNQTARDFERWARRHFVNNDAIAPLFNWESLFHTFSVVKRKVGSLSRIPRFPERARESQPQCLDSMLLCVEEFWGGDRRNQLTQQAASLAPPPTPEHLECGLEENAEQLTIEGIITREWTIATLNCTAAQIDSQQKQELMEWLVEYADYICMGLKLDLEREGQYLDTRMPLWDCPTIV
ncbi:hypothetical protein [Baaleninema simplex]|uniref:hypothetical protein n=1 Tax=Baaleninema simplex TaxID=2862350 RepID=UPI00034D4BB9|nr:hypothetical protein [Baaleninema simplex]